MPRRRREESIRRHGKHPEEPVHRTSFGIIRRAALWRLCRCRHKRHTFAVHRLLRWYRERVDVQSRLPVLATFMGHVRPESTQVYLTITAELLHEANARFHRHFGCLFDEGPP
jgi:integrase/recombinase XerD